MNRMREVGSVSEDGFGVPDGIFGPHPDEFFAGIGRAVTLSALIEDHLRALLQAVGGEGQSAHAGTPPAGLVKKLRMAVTATCGAADSWLGFPDFLARADRVFAYRNTLVHSLWPAQDDGHLFGHRVNPKTGHRLMNTTSMTELRAAIIELVALEDEWHTWFAAANRR